MFSLIKQDEEVMKIKPEYRFNPMRMHARRVELKLTQAQAAEKAGFAQERWSDYEKGLHQPGATAIIGIATALDCSTDYLLGLINNLDELGSLRDDERDVLIRYRSERDRAMREAINEQIANLAKPLRSQIERLIAQLKNVGNTNERSDNP